MEQDSEGVYVDGREVTESDGTQTIEHHPRIRIPSADEATRDKTGIGWAMFAVALAFALVFTLQSCTSHGSADSCPTTAGRATNGPVLGRSAHLGLPESRRASACVNTLTGGGRSAPHYERLTPSPAGSDAGTGSTDGFDAAAQALASGDGGGGSGNSLNPEAPHTDTPAPAPHTDAAPQTPSGPVIVVVPQEPPSSEPPCSPHDPTCGGGGGSSPAPPPDPSCPPEVAPCL